MKSDALSRGRPGVTSARPHLSLRIRPRSTELVDDGTADLEIIEDLRAPLPPGTPLLQDRIPPRLRLLLTVTDLAAGAAGIPIGAALVDLLSPLRAGALGPRQAALAIASLWMALCLHGLYRPASAKLRPSGWWTAAMMARCVPTATILALGLDALWGTRWLTLSSAVAMMAPAILTIPLARILILRSLHWSPVTRIVIVGSGQVAQRVTDRLRRCPDTVVVGMVDDDPRPGLHVMGRLADLPEICRRENIDRILVAFSRTPGHALLTLLREMNARIPISVVPRLFELHSWRAKVEELHGLPLLNIPSAQHSAASRMAKRGIDLLLSGLALVVLALPAVLIGILIRLDSPGPALFLQQRAGRGGRPFTILKFRTMTQDAEQRREAMDGDERLFKVKADPRVTRAGRLLRSTSLDELPQLLNVLRGDMSLVGPRPLPVDDADRIAGAARSRFSVAPGLTGLWQVSGRSDLSYEDLEHLDLVYVRSWSLAWDLRIMAATPRSVLSRGGAY